MSGMAATPIINVNPGRASTYTLLFDALHVGGGRNQRAAIDGNWGLDNREQLERHAGLAESKLARLNNDNSRQGSLKATFTLGCRRSPHPAFTRGYYCHYYLFLTCAARRCRESHAGLSFQIAYSKRLFFYYSFLFLWLIILFGCAWRRLVGLFVPPPSLSCCVKPSSP
jgi:hypothetical protein